MVVIWIVPKTITIDIDAKDADGNDLVSTDDIRMLLTNYDGYIDHDSRKLVLFKPRMKYRIGGGIGEEKKGRMQDRGKRDLS
jgi:hypothetical protein